MRCSVSSFCTSVDGVRVQMGRCAINGRYLCTQSGRIAATIRGTSEHGGSQGQHVFGGTPHGLLGSGAVRLWTVPWRDALLLRILRRRCLDQGPYQRLIGRHPVGEHGPLCPVPLLELHASAPLMIAAREGERGNSPSAPSALSDAAVRVRCSNPHCTCVPVRGGFPNWRMAVRSASAVSRPRSGPASTALCVPAGPRPLPRA